MLDVPINATCYNSEDLAKIINLVWSRWLPDGPEYRRPWAVLFRYWDPGNAARRGASEEVQMYRTQYGKDPLVKFMRVGPAYANAVLTQDLYRYTATEKSHRAGHWVDSARGLVCESNPQLGLGCVVGVVKPKPRNFPDSSPLDLLSSLPSGYAPVELVEQIAFRLYAAADKARYGKKQCSLWAPSSRRRETKAAIKEAGLELRFDPSGARAGPEEIAARAAISLAQAAAYGQQVEMEHNARRARIYEKRVNESIEFLRMYRRYTREARTKRNGHRRDAETLFGGLEAKGGSK